jgi:zinc D-Ala-D-Ala carboxypeptidase
MTWKYFTRDEFACKETGENRIQPSFIDRLDALREACGFAFQITSGYRSPRHSIEAAKDRPGTHAQGIAADIAVSNGIQRRRIVEKALEQGFKGIGVAKEFVHVDDRQGTAVMWTY